MQEALTKTTCGSMFLSKNSSTEFVAEGETAEKESKRLKRQFGGKLLGVKKNKFASKESSEEKKMIRV